MAESKSGLSTGRTYPFSFNEDQVTALLDLIENERNLMGGIPDELDVVLTELHRRRKSVMEERFARQSYELEQLMTKDGD